jgi:hypothetical protein
MVEMVVLSDGQMAAMMVALMAVHWVEKWAVRLVD